MKSLLIIPILTVMAGLMLAEKWNADAASAKISFSIKGPFGTVHGNFTGLKAILQFSEKDFASSSLSATVEAKTVSTGISMRNGDLRNKEEWLNTDKYPVISFKSKKIEKTSSGYKVSGDLTLKGITKPVEIPFTFTSSGATGTFKGQFTINREDYKVGKPGGSVGNPVSISLEVPVKK
jgi:polyisoprenoid-binding protein YceI